MRSTSMVLVGPVSAGGKRRGRRVRGWISLRGGTIVEREMCMELKVDGGGRRGERTRDDRREGGRVGHTDACSTVGMVLLGVARVLRGCCRLAHHRRMQHCWYGVAGCCEGVARVLLGWLITDACSTAGMVLLGVARVLRGCC